MDKEDRMPSIEVGHTDPKEGRGELRGMIGDDISIPSFRPEMIDGRWRAWFLDRFLAADTDQERVMHEVIRIAASMTDITTQRAVYYTLRGAHPDWTYKGQGLGGEDFYAHFISWVMEKLQLHVGLTMQSMGIWAAPRGYIVGDGDILSSRRGRIPLRAKPALGFDLADVGSQTVSRATKVIHFEKDAGFEALTGGDMPKYIEAVFSTSQGQLTEAANKYLRMAEDQGFDIYAVHDGDPSGIQMQLLYGLATKNNCYMPSEFYPTFVKPLGFYPTLGDALGLPPEDVTDKESGIFNNLLVLADEKDQDPDMARFEVTKELHTMIVERKKWEFQALNAMHEKAPQIYLVEALRVHEDPIKTVPDEEDVKADVIEAVEDKSRGVARMAIQDLARRLISESMDQLLADLEDQLIDELEEWETQLNDSLDDLRATDALYFREAIKALLVQNPARYAVDMIDRLAGTLAVPSFDPDAELEVSFTLSDVTAEVDGTLAVLDMPTEVLTKDDIVGAIEGRLVSAGGVRGRLVGRIREALEDRFGPPSQEW